MANLYICPPPGPEFLLAVPSSLRQREDPLARILSLSYAFFLFHSLLICPSASRLVSRALYHVLSALVCIPFINSILSMDAVHPSLENFGLHYAAAAGDDDGVRYALRSGADVNALDAAGKTALMCAIAGNEYVSLRPYE